jgi:hypothetical protein
MTPPRRPTTEEILAKYSKKIESQVEDTPEFTDNEYSQEYELFKQEMLPESSRYRSWAHTLGNLIKIKLSQKEETKIQKYLETAHLDVTPSQALTLSVFSMLLIFFLVLLVGVSPYLIANTIPWLLIFLGFLTSIFVFYYTYTMPQRIANAWRLKASSQMVPAILYIIVYMKHTSNLESAIGFASKHLDAPLAYDFRKIFYEVETGKFSTTKQALNNYLETWKDYSPEFIESFHLIESSLYEPTEARRILILEKALQIMLDGIYEKMLKYTHSIRSPLTNLYMLGIILPTLGLALLPLASTLLGGLFTWQHVFVIFNVIIPFFVFYMTTEVLLKRPGGHGETEILEKNPNYYQFKSKRPWIIALIVAFPFFLIAIIPFLLQIDSLASGLGLQQDYTFAELGIPFFEETKLFDFKKLSDNSVVGPFGPIAALLSLFFPLSVALFFAISYKYKTSNLIKSRKETKELEKEFTNSLFQLGNRLADGIPAEIAFSKVAHSTQGQKTQSFFSLVSQNIQQFGMSIEDAIFSSKRGAILYYPSSLISTSMRILVESVKKGLKVAARSLMSISEYVKNIQKINERLRDLLAEVVSDMKSNMIFLAPLLAGIVVGLASMITMILNRLQALTAFGAGNQEIPGLGSVTNITNIFDINTMIPPYFIQASIGIYIIEITFILTAALVTVDSGKDPLQEKYSLSKNLLRGISIYTITALISILALSILASIALGGLA